MSFPAPLQLLLGSLELHRQTAGGWIWTLIRQFELNFAGGRSLDAGLRPQDVVP